MIEPVLINYLEATLEANEGVSIPVLMEIPEVPSESYPTWPERMVVIEKVGGSQSNHIPQSSFAIQSYGETLYKAAALDEAVREAMDGFTELDEISACRLSSNYNHTDTRMKVYRYQSVYDITHY